MADETEGDPTAAAFVRGVNASRRFVEAVELRAWERQASANGLSYKGDGILDLYDAALEIVNELSKSKVIQNRRSDLHLLAAKMRAANEEADRCGDMNAYSHEGEDLADAVSSFLSNPT